MKPMIFFLMILLLTLPIQAQQCRDYDSYYDCGRGQIYRKIGNRIFGPGNKHYYIQGNRIAEVGTNNFYTQYGNKVMRNDGTTFSKQGSFTMGTDGSRYMKTEKFISGDPNIFIPLEVLSK